MGRYSGVEYIHVQQAKREPDYALKLIDRIIEQYEKGPLHPEYVKYLVDVLKGYKAGKSFKGALNLTHKRGPKPTQPEDLEAQVSCYVRLLVRDKKFKLKHAIEEAARGYDKPDKWVGMTYSKWSKIKTPEGESHLDEILDIFYMEDVEAKYKRTSR